MILGLHVTCDMTLNIMYVRYALHHGKGSSNKYI